MASFWEPLVSVHSSRALCHLGWVYLAGAVARLLREDTRTCWTRGQYGLAPVQPRQRGKFAHPAHAASTPLLTDWCDEFRIPIPVLKSLAACSPSKLRQNLDVLTDFDLLYTELDPFEGPPLHIVGNSTLSTGWTLLQEIWEFTSGDRTLLRQILCDLDFSVLDR